MHYLIHGDYHLASRNYLVSLIEQEKKNKREIIRLDGVKTTLNELIQAAASNSLFGNEKTIVAENFFSRQKSNEQQQILEWLKSYDNTNTLILWESKSIGKVLQRSLPQKTQVKEFKTPALVFKLVEQISPKNKSQALGTLETVLQKEPAEFLFAMICRQIRLLTIIKGGAEVKGAPWMVGKLKKQASDFTLEQLLTNYQKLYRLDKQIKTGQTIMPLSWHLSVWLSEL
ncbi:MAG: hypothetical protein ACOX6V_02220 [Patescibacteria group bacterium]|jgi:DNA polymerase III delta subunit